MSIVEHGCKSCDDEGSAPEEHYQCNRWTGINFFCSWLGLLFSDQLFLSPVMVFIFAPVFPTGLIIICEMYFNQVSLRTALSNFVVTVLILVALIGVLALLVLAAAFAPFFPLELILGSSPSIALFICGL